MTPAMQQFLQIKSDYQDHIVLFRMGDFYETFYEDAKTAAQILGITLTARDKEKKVPMAGIPFHALDNYLPKLIDANQKVVLVEQLEDPKKAVGVVKRGIVKIFTPGTAPITKELRKNIFIAAIDFSDKNYKLFFTDLNEGTIKYIFFNKEEDLLNNLFVLDPKEILLSSSDSFFTEKFNKQLLAKGKLLSYLKSNFFDSLFDESSFTSLQKDIKNINEKGLIALLNYLIETQRTNLSHFSRIEKLSFDKFLKIDHTAFQNLEIFEGQRKDSTSLFQIIDKCSTNSGSKTLRLWLQRPLLDLKEIQSRQSIIQNFRDFGIDEINSLRSDLSDLSDLTRIMSRVGLGSANAKDLRALVSNIGIIFTLCNKILSKNLIPELQEKLEKINKNIKTSQKLLSKINKTIREDPPFSIREGGMISSGISPELDEFIQLRDGGKEWLKNFEKEQLERTKLSSLKVRFNKVFGYYIEISKAQAEKAPDDFIRKQTLVNAERFITTELKEYEVKVLSADENICKLEYEIFSSLLEETKSILQEIQTIAEEIAEVDVLLNLAFISINSKWTRPEISEVFSINIEGGRHPVIEELLQREGKPFVKNNYVSSSDSSLQIITGPNMGGKSTYLRQNAIIVILAQIGSFVPADKASISIVDKVFTRVGASDNLSAGESTFMVEMLEAANILKNATSKSLVILDEIGRGTSTFDGMSLAWAICEFVSEIGCKTIFATHYHELTELSNKLQNIKNFNVKVVEYNGEIVFMHQIIPGKADRSYGIHVAKLAGLPSKVISNANRILKLLEKEKNKLQPKPQDLFSIPAEESSQENNLDSEYLEIIEKIKNLEINNVSPLEALQILSEMKSLLSNNHIK